MFSSSELIEALQRRLRKGRSIRPPRPAGEFPPGWGEWFALPGPSVRTGFAPQGLVDVFLAREPKYPKGYRRLGSLRAFVRLWRQDWREGPPPDHRRRRLALAVSVLLHALWLQLMILLIVAHPPGATEERLGEQVTQVEFIGEGTPEEEGGGSQQAEQPEPEVAASPEPAAPAPAAAASEASPPPPPPSVAKVEPPREEVPPPVAEQPLAVTETPEPDIDFVLTPPRIDVPRAPALETPELRAPAPEVRVVEVPSVVPPQIRPLPRRDVTVPDVRQPEIEIVEREIPAPAPEIALRAPRQAAPAPELRRDGPAIVERDIELRAPSPASGAAQRPSEAVVGAGPDASGDAPSEASSSGGVRDSGQGAAPSAATAGAGPATSPAPGALPSPRRGDDWGDSTRNVPGGQAGSSSGLFNADGSPRLAGDSGKVGGGLPPGTITEDYEKIDRMGTWLKRPPTDYEPTAFDRFWVPHETLLEEWVRRSIKEVLIPIPGTGKRIKCTVAMLMLGGACGISDPNMLDVEANARKPPDVPFKRELQEDQESLQQPPATP